MEISFRLDLPEFNAALLRRIIAVCAAADAALVSREERVFEAEWSAVMAEVSTAPATHFVRDPMAFLAQVAAGRDSGGQN